MEKRRSEEEGGRKGKEEKELLKRRIVKERRRTERAKRKGYLRSFNSMGTEIAIFVWVFFPSLRLFGLNEK